MPLSGCNNIAASAIQVSSNLTAECSLAGLLVVNQIRNTWSFQNTHTKDRRKTRLVSQAGMTDNPWLFLLLATPFPSVTVVRATSIRVSTIMVQRTSV